MYCVKSSQTLKLKTLQSGNKTADNDRFLRFFWEVGGDRVGSIWILYAKGGAFRRWYGNIEWVIDWSEKALQCYKYNSSASMMSEKYLFKNGLTWTDLTSGLFSIRLLDGSCLFDMSGPAILIQNESRRKTLLGLFNTKVVNHFLKVLNSSFHVKLNDIRKVPIILPKEEIKVIQLTDNNIHISKTDWDAFETSWDFKKHPLI